LLENQLDFLLLFLTSVQESLRALCPLRVPLDSGSSTHSIQLPTPGPFRGTIHTPRQADPPFLASAASFISLSLLSPPPQKKKNPPTHPTNFDENTNPSSCRITITLSRSIYAALYNLHMPVPPSVDYVQSSPLPFVPTLLHLNTPGTTEC
jgi:hypothetical protein